MTEQPPTAPDTKPKRPRGPTQLPVIIVFAWMSGAAVTFGVAWLVFASHMSAAVGVMQIALGVVCALHVVLGYRNVRHRYSTKPGRANSPQ